MSIIIQWVSQIIIFILLATIVDLLTPATAMKKYIKLVIGLILLLIFLKPLFHIIHFNFENSLETSISQIYNEQYSNDSTESLINNKKSEIQASQDAYILKQMTNQLKEIAKKPLFEQYEKEITHIELRFSTEMTTYDSLEQVIVYVKESSDQEDPVTIIEEIVIDTKSQVKQDKPELDIDGIADLLQEIWELDNKKLIIKWEGGIS